MCKTVHIGGESVPAVHQIREEVFLSTSCRNQQQAAAPGHLPLTHNVHMRAPTQARRSNKHALHLFIALRLRVKVRPSHTGSPCSVNRIFAASLHVGGGCMHFTGGKRAYCMTCIFCMVRRENCLLHMLILPFSNQLGKADQGSRCYYFNAEKS
jgi:hypothetical protein